MTTLKGPSRAAASGKATSQVIFLHGYGADGEDLVGLAGPLAPHLPDTRFLAPNAPERCINNPMGYQWFPIPWLDGSDPAAAAVAAGSAFALLDGWLDAATAEGIGPERTALFGFSQGTMMALQVGLRRKPALAGIVGFSGRLLRPEKLAAEIAARPPVLLVHGDEDPMVPVASLAEAAEALRAAGVETATHVSRGVGHGIAPDGLGLAVGFLRDRLGYGG
ncbi:dienelactone hydrolase family protein [Amaricoccus sp.]|uniref:alpha/beta hydrolase n=1 Tax=Amaricoccus sp. TaxID=1872485 RepID=UPI001B55E94A|nr:dienelactone hydrolase family protein [Amaricoccus sp.]MBP7002579.1 dienelactone hydrolase family protein [Amaricoccus sp.]